MPSIGILLPLVMGLTAGCSSGGGTSTTNNNNSNNTGSLYKQNVSNTAYDSHNPLIGADAEGNIYVVWEETVPAPEHNEIYLTKSNDSGGAFTSAKSLTDLRGTKCPTHIVDVASSEASMALRGNSPLYLTWTYSWVPSGNGTATKFFREEDEFCSSVSDITRNASSPYIGISGSDRIHTVWTEEVDGQDEIFYRRSVDSGDTFSPSGSPLRLSYTADDSSGPLLGFDGSLNVDVIWTEGSEGGRNISFIRSTDGGESFSAYYAGSVSETGIDSHCPVIATQGENNIYITYKGDNKIYFTRWVSSEYSFSTSKVISPGSSAPSCPEMGVGENGMIYVVWADMGEIWLTKSTAGKYFLPFPKNISNSTGESTSPKMVIDESYVSIVWVEEGTGQGDIFLSASIDNGKNFSSPGNLSGTSTPSTSPVVAVDGEKYIYVAWVEGEEGSRDIYFGRDEAARGGPPVIDEIPLDRLLDVGGDGKSDIVTGAPGANSAGEVYLFFSDSIQGELNGSDISTSSAGKTFTGESAGDLFGHAVAIAGDINGDEYADIIVGAPDAQSGGDNAGKAYIYFGGPPSLMDTAADVIISGTDSSDNVGYSVSPAGDVNNDGFDDIIISARNRYQSGNPYAGEAYIFYGGSSLTNKDGYPDLLAEDADVILKGEKAQDKFGSSVSWAGDFNKDGYDDVIVGAPLADVSINDTRGRAYIYYGGTAMDSTADVKITGAANFDQLGYSLSRAGDMNGDGYGDVVIGAPMADMDIGGDNKGKAYIIYGGGSAVGSIDLAASSASVTVLSGFEVHEFFGTSVGYGSDVNNDGYSDVVVGGQYLGMNSAFTGRAYVYLGGASVDNTPDVTFISENQEDRFGTAVAGAGDVNGDGYYDVLVGAYLSDGDGSDRGRASLYLGAPISDLDNAADATFTGGTNDGWAGYSLHKEGR